MPHSGGAKFTHGWLSWCPVTQQVTIAQFSDLSSAETSGTQGFGSLTVSGFCRRRAEGLQTLFTIVPTLGPVLIILQGAEFAVPSKALGSARRDKLKQVLLWEVTPGESPATCRGKGVKLQPEHTHQLGSTCHHLLTSLPRSSPLQIKQGKCNETEAKPCEDFIFNLRVDNSRHHI